MYAKTQFETIINLTKFQAIKIEWHVRQDSGNVFHVISTVSEERSKTSEERSDLSLSGKSTITSSSAILAQFPEDMKRETEWAYNTLFTALSEGQPTFDMTGYFSSHPVKEESL